MPDLRLSWILLAAPALIASPAFAGSPCTDLVPPARYASMPTPHYHGPYAVSTQALHDKCPTARLACTIPGPTIIYDRKLDLAQNYARRTCVIAHEEAHVKGWPADHPTELALSR